MNNNSKSCLLSAISLVCLAIITGVMSYITPWTIDDVFYQYSFDDGSRIGSISDIFYSQVAHLWKINGRFVAHFLCQFLLTIAGRAIYAFVNGLLHAYLVWIVARLANVSFAQWRLVALLSMVMLILDTGFALVQQVGYVWMPALALTYIHIFQNVKINRPWAIILIGFFSLIAGNSHETLTIGIGGALAVYALIHLRSLSVQRWVMIMSFGLGALLLVTAPGSLRRANSESIPLIASLYSFVTRGIPIYIFPIAFFISVKRHLIELNDFARENSFLLWTAGFQFLFMFITGVGSGSYIFGLNTLCVILLFALLRRCNISKWWLVPFGAYIAYSLSMQTIYNKVSVDNYNEIYAALKIRENDTIYVRAAAISPNNAYQAYMRSLQIDQAGFMIPEKETPDIVIYPKEFKDMQMNHQDYGVIKLRDGEYMFFRQKGSDVSFMVNRRFKLFGLSFPFKPYVIDFGIDQRFNNDRYDVMYLLKSYPFLDNYYPRVLN